MRMSKTSTLLALGLAAAAVTGCAVGHGTVAGLFLTAGGPGPGVTAGRLPGG